MKRVLITGKGSYVGTNFKKYMQQYSNEYKVEELDLLDVKWIEKEFSEYDVIYHVAGLAHSSPNDSQRDLYYKVNTELAYEVARKAKKEGVSQFIFMSSVIVYGAGIIGTDRVIKKDTPLLPDNFYGDSKKQAEIKIKSLEDDKFKIVIIRSPMIYGPNSKGNYPFLSKFAKKTLIFPNLRNKRSMIFLENLLEFVRIIIKNEEKGIFFPQNEEYVSTLDLVKIIAKIHNHKILYVKIFNPILKLLNQQKYVNKVFGNLTIDKELSYYKEPYCKYNLEDSIRITEGKI